MTVTTGFLIYATLFRLAVLGVGALAVWLGYQLFIQDPLGGGKGQKTSASAEGGGFKVTLTNFWPGAYFALFGTIIVGIMLWQGAPELVIEDLQKAVAAGEHKGGERIRLKSGGDGSQTVGDGVHWLQCFADDRLAQGDADAALAAYAQLLAMPELTLGEAVPALTGAASVYLEKARPQEALPLARLAVGLDESSAVGLVMLSRALEATGDWSGAVTAMEAAAKLDAGLAESLAALQKRRP